VDDVLPLRAEATRPLKPSNTGVDRDQSSSWTSRLEMPLSQWWCALSWFVASATFVGLTRLLGGVTTGDASDSVNTTWALAHGIPSCGYASGNQFGLPYTGPLYPLLSSGVAALLRIGHSTPFPTRTQMGPHCSTAIMAMYHWSVRSHALLSTVQIGYVSWFLLMGGVVALLRATGRGRCGWEPVALMIVAIAPPVYMCLHEYFHPQDLAAMGLVLAGIACVQRGYWIWAGVLLGLAFTGQQFALLAFAPLLVVAPRDRRTRFVAAALFSVVAIVGPLTALASSKAMSVALIGSGDSSVANTLLGVLHPEGRLVLILSRFVPIVLAVATARWASKRVGSAILEPIPLISLMATSLSFRLIFEVNLWGYYFMAVAVLLLILDVIRGRIRVLFLIWLALVVVAFYPTSDPAGVFETATPLWLPLWLWQLILVPIAVALAAGPLLSWTRDRPGAEEVAIGVSPRVPPDQPRDRGPAESVAETGEITSRASARDARICNPPHAPW
jgi:hypothetical protein